MKYLFHLSSFAMQSAAISAKHAKLISELMALDGPWGLPPASYPTPDPGKELSADFRLGKSLRGSGVRGFVSYRYRGGLRDDSGCDDYMILEFNPARVDFAALVQNALPRYIHAFEPYFGYISDEEFTFTDFHRSRDVNSRHTLLRMFPICFLSEDYCRKTLKRGAGEVADQVRGWVESVEVTNTGVIVMASKAPLPFEKAKPLSDDLTRLVGARVD
jgi:hypothetical protein